MSISFNSGGNQFIPNNFTKNQKMVDEKAQKGSENIPDQNVHARRQVNVPKLVI